MRNFLLVIGFLLLESSVPLAAQQRADTSLTIDRIFHSGDFQSAPMPNVHWLKDGRSYLDTRPHAGGGADIVRIDLATGTERVIADASSIVDANGKRIDIEDITLSPDESKALLFHGSVRVWRQNTRGSFSILDFATGKVVSISRGESGVDTLVRRNGEIITRDTTQAPALGQNPSFIAPRVRTGLQMFAKFSPDGRQVAFVSDNDLYVTEVASGKTKRLTTDGSAEIINGTTDWVYEEELDLRDAFRWSPDSKRIAYWRFDQSGVGAFPIENDLPTYPVVGVLRYPKAGTPNSRVKVGVLDVATARTTWMQTGADTGVYIARMDWAGKDSVVIQRLPRRQNRVDVLMANASTGATRTVLTDTDSAYVDVQDQPTWIGNGAQFLWITDKSGWRQVFLYDRSGRQLRQVTTDGMDVISVAGVDEKRQLVYVVAAAPTPTQRQLYVASYKQTSVRRLTTEAGTHAPTIGPGALWAVDVHSTSATPATATVYELPAWTKRRTLVDNAAMRANVASTGTRTEFFRMPMPDGTQLDAFRVVPANFDSTRKYPVLMYVYGGPAAPTVNDAWGGTRELWHMLLAQRGYVIVSVDNRGAAWRGRAFRKVTQLHLGRHESRDQIDAAKWLGRQRWVDSSRIGIWGWSYGGYMTALSTALGGDVFRMGIAVAPVTDWRNYDTIYTERLMWTPQDNAQGYDESAPLAHVAGLRARLFVVHGTGDDNVHPQNTIQFAEKLQDAGKPFWMMLYPNRTHSISGGNAQAHLFESMTRFVLENL
jgi:dipeptidyl-peptidase-4